MYLKDIIRGDINVKIVIKKWNFQIYFLHVG